MLLLALWLLLLLLLRLLPLRWWLRSIVLISTRGRRSRETWWLHHSRGWRRRCRVRIGTKRWKGLWLGLGHRRNVHIWHRLRVGRLL
uniref:Putative secreted peptide n=1 Tax=Anopheles braziliensis TaxID=58242 RepID=A0A2M3ZR28_9DIPT